MGMHYYVLTEIPSRPENSLWPVMPKYLDPSDRVFDGPPRRQTAATICFPHFHPFPFPLFTPKPSQHSNFTTANKTRRIHHKIILEDHQSLAFLKRHLLGIISSRLASRASRRAATLCSPIPSPLTLPSSPCTNLTLKQ
jgi:hypothetical protein